MPIRLTVKQEAYCRRAQGVRRFCYNLAVATLRFHRSNRMPWPLWQDIYKAFNACKAEDYPMVTEVASRVAEGAFMDFGKAVTNWRNPEVKARAPSLIKRKATGEGSFRAASGITQIRYDGKRRVRLPVIGSIKLACTLPRGIYHEAHIRKQNGRWYLCLKLWQEPHPAPAPDIRTAGAVDTGINPSATDSDGQAYQNPKAYYAMERKLKRWQRAQVRRTKSSRGWWEAQRRIDRCHRRIREIRHNAIHQMTNTLTRKYNVLVIEDLNVAGMMAGSTPKAQADASMGEIRRQLEYKGPWRQVQLILAHRQYPSSKLCSSCQCHNAKLKRERHWTCPACGTRHERNGNAAANLKTLVPPGRGPMLRDGKALAGASNAGETGPDDRRTAPPTLREGKADCVRTGMSTRLNTSKEPVSYPKQEPLALLERSIQSSRKPGDINLDSFCGCATACVASDKLDRQLVETDLSPKANNLVQQAPPLDIGSLFHHGYMTARTDIPTSTDIEASIPCQNKHVLIGQQQGLCRCIREMFPFRNITIDHMVPQSRGGNDHIESLQLLCGTCNSLKGNRPVEYLVAGLAEA